MKNQVSLSLLLSLILISTAQANEAPQIDAELLNESVDLVQTLNANPASASQSKSTQDSMRVGMIQSTDGEMIEIDCSKGTLEKCEEISFYYVVGVKSNVPLATLTLQTLTLENKPEYQFGHVSQFVFNNSRSDVPVVTWGLSAIADIVIVGNVVSLGAGGITLAAILASPYLIDAILTPYSAIKYWVQASQYKNAQKAIFDAMRTGATITIGKRTFNRLKTSLEATKP